MFKKNSGILNDMLNIEEIKRHYFFTEEDERDLKRVGQIVSPYADQFSTAFLEYLSSFPEIASYFKSEEAKERRVETIRHWLMMLFRGRYDYRYLVELQHIGEIHVRREIPIHWVTASMNFKREYLTNILRKEVEDNAEFQKLSKSLGKILDINLDVLVSSYHEEEIKRIFLTKRMDNALIRFAERFTYGLNLVLILALIGLSLGVVALFVKDLQAIVISKEIEKGIIPLLGTLLMIWVMVELMGTEIKYLRGERFRIEIFISVALVAIIRELLIATLAHEPLQKVGMLLAAILILGVVYYLISRTETHYRM